MADPVAEVVTGWLAAFLVGCAVKVADAAADGEPAALPAAAAPWCLVLMALAAGLRPKLAASLGASAWVVGMGWSRAATGPRRWAWRLEAALVAAAAAAAVGPWELLASAVAVGSVQVLDDWIDGDLPPPTRPSGWAARLAGVALVGTALWVHPLRLGLVLAATPVAEAAGRWLAARPALSQAGDSQEKATAIAGPRWAG